MTIAPPTKRNRTLIYVRPESGDGSLHIAVILKAFAEFFPHLHEREIVEALAGSDWESSGSKQLDETLDRIERFLKDKLPQPDSG